MGNPGADRFLNCVLNRNEHDTIISVVVIALVILGTPAYILGNMISFQIEVGDIFYLEDYYTVVLYMSIIATFVLLIVIRSLERHKKRDLEWMESLIEYAKFDGKDTKGLECVRSELPAIMKPKYVTVAFVVTGITLAADIAQIFCWAFSANYDSNAIRI